MPTVDPHAHRVQRMGSVMVNTGVFHFLLWL
ncbi:uncharacterized protein ARMOST_10448 [Armillaria ostoyae]|uniref:Uncharacterized protein n=1 Tax=Armillaria ostoyae TaxID=47428 RepID=A0A284REE2_ARMOS|nr:uncharacterized protein ARMOST_10448 [Armillaria ostoyae]